jgi:spermidine synthase
LTTFTDPSASALPTATISESAGVRYLHLDTQWVQGAMRIDKPLALELEYVQRMMVWLLLRQGGDLGKGHAVQLGLGSGAISRYCHGKLSMKTTAVELNPAVIDACRTWFHLPPETPRFTVIQQDAAAFVADPARAESAQALCVDLYDHEAAAPVLDSETFYADCWRLLGQDGVMTVNVFGRDSNLAQSAQRIAAAFGQAQVRTLEPTAAGNMIVMAIKSPTFPDSNLLAARARSIETRFHLPARKWLPLIRPLSQ